MGTIIGTAGHIDHGKTSLVKLLTGQDTDRLRAERERGISIDLGFAYFELADGRRAGIVDVPGHERFIRNMVAGVHGIDLVLFVVAADDGIMPQTLEHFDIVRAMGVERAVFALTKADRVDGDRLAQVGRDIEGLIRGSPLSGSPILPVSNTTGAGLEALRANLVSRLNEASAPTVESAFRMPIDRVFSVHGRGVVVTGTVVAGRVEAGAEVAVEPARLRARIRGLQSHGHDVRTGRAGDRLAINLAGAERSTLSRGEVVCDRAIARSTLRFDARVGTVAHAPAGLKTGQRLRLHLGTAERRGTIKLLGGARAIAPGGTEFAQIVVRDPLQVMAGDRFILRDETAQHTLAGGIVLDPVAADRTFKPDRRLAYLAAMAAGDKVKAIETLVGGTADGLDAADLAFRMNMPADELLARVGAGLVAVEAGGGRLITSREYLDALERRIDTTLRDHHLNAPVSPGMTLDALRRAIAADETFLRRAVAQGVESGRLVRNGARVALAGHQVALPDELASLAEDILRSLNATPFSPPDLDLQDSNVAKVADYLEHGGYAVRIGGDLLFSADAVGEALQRLTHYLDARGSISVAQFRDVLGTSRKFAMALLESFDKSGHTVRVGDTRRRHTKV